LLDFLQDEDDIPEGQQRLVKIMTVNDFLFATSIDNVNLFQLTEFIQQSGIVKKLNGFVDFCVKEQEKENSGGKAAVGKLPVKKTKNSLKGNEDETQESDVKYRQMSVLGRIKTFLVSLTNANKDGRVYVEKCREGGKISGDSNVCFVMLNPEVNFLPILQEAKAVLLLGGTMKPFCHFTQQLFPSVPRQNLHYFECGHVVPPEHVLALALAKGPSGKPLKFTFQSRTNTDTIDELGRTINNISKLVPEGFVLFFPSFGYKDVIQKRWSSTGALAQICKKVMRLHLR